MTQEEINRLAKFIELLDKINREKKIVPLPTSDNPNSRN